MSRKTAAEEEHRLRFVVRAAVEQNCLRKEEEMHWIDPLKVEAAFHPGGWLEWREP